MLDDDVRCSMMLRGDTDGRRNDAFETTSSFLYILILFLSAHPKSAVGDLKLSVSKRFKKIRFDFHFAGLRFPPQSPPSGSAEVPANAGQRRIHPFPFHPFRFPISSFQFILHPFPSLSSHDAIISRKISSRLVSTSQLGKWVFIFRWSL